MIRVFIIDQILLVCHVMGTALEEERDIQVVGYTTNMDEAIGRVQPGDVVLINANMPHQDVFRLLRALSRDKPAVKVLVIGISTSQNEILRYIEGGAAGYVLKDDSTETLLQKIRAAANEQALVSPQIAASLINRVSELAELCGEDSLAVSHIADLTPREREVLQLIEQGCSNQEIAAQLKIEIGTVKNHVHKILKKLNVRNRRAAVVYATSVFAQSNGGNPS